MKLSNQLLSVAVGAAGATPLAGERPAGPASVGRAAAAGAGFDDGGERQGEGHGVDLLMVVVAGPAAAGAAVQLGRLAARLGCNAPGAEATRRA